MTNPIDKLVKLYVKKVVRLHGVPISILFDRDPRFTSILWLRIQNVIWMELKLSTAFHPQTDGQTNRIIQTLEDLLMTCVLDFGVELGRILASGEIHV